MLKRVFDPPPRTLDSSAFEALLAKRTLAELRAAVQDGTFEAAQRKAFKRGRAVTCSASSGSEGVSSGGGAVGGGDGANSAISGGASAGGSGARASGGHGAGVSSARGAKPRHEGGGGGGGGTGDCTAASGPGVHHGDGGSPTEPQVDPEWQRQQLAAVQREIEEEQAASREDKRAERARLAAEQEAATAELAELRERLQGIKGEKHEAVQQLKKVGSGWAANQAV
jgi:hypothetical protein